LSVQKRSICKLSLAAVVFCTSLISPVLVHAQTVTSHVPLGIVSDWTHHHVLFPDSKKAAVMARIQKDPRWLQNWYLRHPGTWWPERPRRPREDGKASRRDWNISLTATPSTSGFEPLFDFAFDIAPETGYGSFHTTDEGNGQFLANSGNLTVTGGSDIGTYTLYPGGPGQTLSPMGGFNYDNLLYPFYPTLNPPLDDDGLLFTNPGVEINIWGNSPDNYSFYDYYGSGYPTALTEDGTFTLDVAPGGGQTYPAKFVFDVTAAPSCTNDYVVIGIPANPASGGQANIFGVNNLYSYQGTPPPGLTPDCPTNGPTVMFAYASGSGQVPASVAISLTGTQIAYIENLTVGSSYFHVLTLGTTSFEGTATAAVVPGTGGSNAVDQRVLLSPDGGTTNQSSTNTVFVDYADDVAYATTYSFAGNGSGYLYKISNVFNGSATPTIVWSIPIDAVPSTPVYDLTSNNVYFTDSSGRIDYVTDNGATPSAVVYGTALANGTTAENPVIVDGANEMVYATFNSNGTNALVVQAPTSLASSVSVPVGAANTTYTAPYSPNFNNAWFTGSGTPLLYVAGMDTSTGTVPTLYSVGFNGSGVLNSSAEASTALATGLADSSPLTEFYNTTLGKDFLFVGVTNDCIAATGGGDAGCVMSLDITDGFPTVNADSTALAAAGGTTGIIVDNNSSLTEASSIYYGTKTGVTLVKATQSGLN
jgi:hypothetical protein